MNREDSHIKPPTRRKPRGVLQKMFFAAVLLTGAGLALGVDPSEVADDLGITAMTTPQKVGIAGVFGLAAGVVAGGTIVTALWARQARRERGVFAAQAEAIEGHEAIIGLHVAHAEKLVRERALERDRADRAEAEREQLSGLVEALQPHAPGRRQAN